MAPVLDVEPKPRTGRARATCEHPPVAAAWSRGALPAAIVVGAVLIANLSQSAPRLAGVDKTPPRRVLDRPRAGSRTCQSGEVVPADAGAVSLVLGLFDGRPQPLEVTVIGWQGGAGARAAHVCRTALGSSRRSRATGGRAPACAVRAQRRRWAHCARGDRRRGAGRRRVGRSCRDASPSAGTGRAPSRGAPVASAVAYAAAERKAGWIGAWTMWAALAAVLAPAVLAVAAVAGARHRPARWSGCARWSRWSTRRRGRLLRRPSRRRTSTSTSPTRTTS